MTTAAAELKVPGAETTAAFYVTGGTLGTGAASYVERRADRDPLGGLTAGDYCCVLNSRQMERSSLRAMRRLQEQGGRTCFLDLTKFGGRNLSAEQWHAALLSEADDNPAFVRSRLPESEVDRAGLLDLYGRMRRGRRVPDDEADPLCAVLKLSGVGRTEKGQLRVRNRVYEHVFRREWIVAHTPGSELRRQREAFQRGLIRAWAVAACVVLVLALLALSACQNACGTKTAVREALAAKAGVLAEKTVAERSLYAADMSRIQQAWENNSVGQAVALLQETQADQYASCRGFEWGCWNRMCHCDLMTLKGHTGTVFSAAFSDGSRIVTASKVHTARV